MNLEKEGEIFFSKNFVTKWECFLKHFVQGMYPVFEH